MQCPFLRRCVPELTSVSTPERVRAACGAMIGLFLTGLISHLTVGSGATLIAPMGASAVLLFAVPSSPLAQPSSILGVNIVSALVGVTAAITLMMLLGCLHPPAEPWRSRPCSEARRSESSATASCSGRSA